MTAECTCNCDNGYACDVHVQHRRLRAIALSVTEPIHRAAAEAEWQLTRLVVWLRDEH